MLAIKQSVYNICVMEMNYFHLVRQKIKEEFFKKNINRTSEKFCTEHPLCARHVLGSGRA
jgi:hypothetical protein